MFSINVVSETKDNTHHFQHLRDRFFNSASCCFNDREFLGIEEDGRIVAMGGLCQLGYQNTEEGMLVCGAVLEEYRGRGYHKILLKARIERAKEKGYKVLYICTGSEAVKHNITKAGFIPTEAKARVTVGGFATFKKVLTEEEKMLE